MWGHVQNTGGVGVVVVGGGGVKAGLGRKPCGGGEVVLGGG